MANRHATGAGGDLRRGCLIALAAAVVFAAGLVAVDGWAVLPLAIPAGLTVGLAVGIWLGDPY